VQDRKRFWLMLLLTVITIFVNIGSIPLLDPDEPFYAETPKEMMLVNDFISPRIYGDFWYDKPPMYYWLVAGSFKAFGVSEFAARFPSALSAVLCVVLVYWAMARIFNERAGIISGLVLGSAVEYFYLGKAAVTDSTLTLFLTASLVCFLERKDYLFYIFCALATLTKGPIGFLFPGAIIFIWMAVTRRFDEIKNMKIPAGITIFLIIAGPWYWEMYRLHGAAFIDGFIGVNNIVRFTTAEHARTSGWYFFIPVLIIGFFPWSALMGQAIWSALKTKESKERKTLLFLFIWAAFIFVFFSISNTKLLSYILPVYPPLAMLVGWYLDRSFAGYRLAGWSIGWLPGLGILAVLMAGGFVFGVKSLPEIRLGAFALALVIIAMVSAVGYFLKKCDVGKAVWVQASAMALVSIIMVTLLLPPVMSQFSSREIARDFLTHYDGKTTVYVSKFLHPGFTYYTDVYGNELKSGADFAKEVAENRQAYFVVRQSDYMGLSNEERRALIVILESDQKMLLKR